MTNIKIGSTYEDLAAQILLKHGYWAHVIQKSVHGQPVDIVAAKNKNGNNIIYLLDVKHVRENVPSFTLSRLEPNQLASLDFAKTFAKLDKLGFAIYFERTHQWYWLKFELATSLIDKGAKSVKLDVLPKFEEILE